MDLASAVGVHCPPLSRRSRLRPRRRWHIRHAFHFPLGPLRNGWRSEALLAVCIPGHLLRRSRLCPSHLPVAYGSVRLPPRPCAGAAAVLLLDLRRTPKYLSRQVPRCHPVMFRNTVAVNLRSVTKTQADQFGKVGGIRLGIHVLDRAPFDPLVGETLDRGDQSSASPLPEIVWNIWELSHGDLPVTAPGSTLRRSIRNRQRRVSAVLANQHDTRGDGTGLPPRRVTDSANLSTGSRYPACDLSEDGYPEVGDGGPSLDGRVDLTKLVLSAGQADL
jgi:hypothetical protein